MGIAINKFIMYFGIITIVQKNGPPAFRRDDEK
jgi:hypothetical protein